MLPTGSVCEDRTTNDNYFVANPEIFLNVQVTIPAVARIFLICACNNVYQWRDLISYRNTTYIYMYVCIYIYIYIYIYVCVN